MSWGERANDREAPEAKGSPRRLGGRATRASVLTRGDPASRLKGRRASARREESAEAVVVPTKPMKEAEVFVENEGPNERTG